jgi:hypothetical protein
MIRGEDGSAADDVRCEGRLRFAVGRYAQKRVPPKATPRHECGGTRAARSTRPTSALHPPREPAGRYAQGACRRKRLPQNQNRTPTTHCVSSGSLPSARA